MSLYRKIVCAAILFLYGLSFLLPTTSRPEYGSLVDFYSGLGSSNSCKVAGVLYGYEVFLDLAIGVIIPSATWVWFANPALWVGMIFLATKRWKWASGTGIGALILAILAGSYVISNDRDMQLYMGYFVWLGSTVLLALSSMVLANVEPQKMTSKG